jgi:hypothetical protein
MKALMLTSAILWGAVVFLTGITNLIWSGYGTIFLQLMASLYPGYDASRTMGSVIVGTLYALFDGAVFGLVFSWLYNLFLGKGRPAVEAILNRWQVKISNLKLRGFRDKDLSKKAY